MLRAFGSTCAGAHPSPALSGTPPTNKKKARRQLCRVAHCPLCTCGGLHTWSWAHVAAYTRGVVHMTRTLYGHAPDVCDMHCPVPAGRERVGPGPASRERRARCACQAETGHRGKQRSASAVLHPARFAHSRCCLCKGYTPVRTHAYGVRCCCTGHANRGAVQSVQLCTRRPWRCTERAVLRRRTSQYTAVCCSKQNTLNVR